MAEKILSLDELVALRDAELQQGQATLDTAEREDRELTDEEVENLGASRAKVEGLNERIDRKRTADEHREALHDAAEHAIAVPVPRTLPSTAVTRVRETLRDDPSRGWGSLGDFAVAVHSSQSNLGTDRRLLLDAGVTGMSQGVGADGGFLVPPEFSRVIWDGLNTGSQSLLGLTDNYSIEGESLTFPANAETSRVDGSRYGGVRGYWLAEADQITHSKPKLRQLKLEPQELAVLVYVTEKLLKNGGAAIDQYVTRAATEEIAFKTGDAIVNGDGVGKPLGLINSSALVTTSRVTASKFTQTDVAGMWARLHVRSMPSAVWLINQDVLPELLLMVTAVQNLAATENVGGFSSTLFNAERMTLMGRPVIVSEYCPTLGTDGDVILVDLGAYATGTRGGVDSALSIHLRFDYAEAAFRFMFAVDGQTWLNSPLTPFKGSNTLSTVVVTN